MTTSSNNVNAPKSRAPRAPRASKLATVTGAVYTLETAKELGHSVAIAAVAAHVQAGSIWASCRTYLVAAIKVGKGAEFVDAFREGGSNVKGAKAAWFRTYLCIMAGVVKYGVKVDDSMGAKALQVAVQEAKAEATPTSEAQAAALEMFQRSAQGCLNRGLTLAKLRKVLDATKATTKA